MRPTTQHRVHLVGVSGVFWLSGAPVWLTGAPAWLSVNPLWHAFAVALFSFSELATAMLRRKQTKPRHAVFSSCSCEIHCI